MRSKRELRGRKDPSFWKAINRVLTVLVFLGFCACVVFWFYPEVAYRNKLARDLEVAKAKEAEQLLERKQHEREVYLLENDPAYIETIARDKLDLMKEGETIFRFDTPKNIKPGTTN